MSGVPGATLAVANAVNPTGTFAGYVFTIRLNGQIYADVVEGWARMPATGLRGIEVPGVAMSHDSSIHLASCSKEICHAALLAMVEDWSALEVGIRAGRNAPASPMRSRDWPSFNWRVSNNRNPSRFSRPMRATFV